MNELLSNLSDINRLESRRFSFDVQQFDWVVVLKELLEGYLPRFEEKEQHFSFEPAAESLSVTGDPVRSVQVVGYLLDNAQKYTAAGGHIYLRIKEHRTDGQIFMRIDVEDDGYGMSDEDRRNATHQFFRSTDPQIREQVGWGLGLSVANRLVEAMGGTFELQSTLGQGTKATICLPRDSKLNQ